MKSLLERVRKKYGNINTAVHASGILRDVKQHGNTAEDMRTSFGFKAAGSLYLHQHTAELDGIWHFVLFSSISAMFVNPGQDDYTASNSYLNFLV